MLDIFGTTNILIHNWQDWYFLPLIFELPKKIISTYYVSHLEDFQNQPPVIYKQKNQHAGEISKLGI